MTKRKKVGPPWTIYICPACGERVDDERVISHDGKSPYGHYHAPPPGWPSGEDPWFDGVPVKVVPEETHD